MNVDSFDQYTNLIKRKLESFKSKAKEYKSLYKVLGKVAMRQNPSSIGVSLAFDGLTQFVKIAFATRCY